MQDNIQPEIYRDDQVRAAIQELFNYEDFLDGMKAFVPVQLNKLILDEVYKVETASEFQAKVISPFLKAVKQSSITDFTYSGLEDLDSKESYLFISNHRDIVLDSAYLNMVLLENGMQTSQIAIGDNLIANRLTELLFKINKSFVIKRSGNPREIYRHATLLSQYIGDTINNKKDSIWIAQREGRAKDGNDRTQIALLKMLSLSAKGKDLIEYFKNLKIVPVSISYEYDPCCFLKTIEHIEKQRNPAYKKDFKQDAAHLLLGIKGNKGHVHFHFEKPLNNRLEAITNFLDLKNQLKCLASIIDKVIHENYKLHPINYFAFDSLSKNKEHLSHYKESKDDLDLFFTDQINQLPIDQQKEGREFMLRMYANPLKNAKSYE